MAAQKPHHCSSQRISLTRATKLRRPLGFIGRVSLCVFYEPMYDLCSLRGDVGDTRVKLMQY